jgi:hypothetical protein
LNVQSAGGLPEYICIIARAIKKTGKTTGEAISIAVSRVKKWAAGVGVDKGTQAKAAKAVAEWEKLKATSHAKADAKDAKKVAASGDDISDAWLLAQLPFISPCHATATDQILLSIDVARQHGWSALEQILALTAKR